MDLANGLRAYFFVYADDIVVIIVDTDFDNLSARMNEVLQIISCRLKKLGLIISIAKTKAMTIAKKRNKRCGLIHIDDRPVERVTEFKYLGVLIDQNLIFKEFIIKQETQVLKALT